MSDEESDSRDITNESALFEATKQSKVRDRITKLKERNEANRKIRSFINLLRKKDTGT